MEAFYCRANHQSFTGSRGSSVTKPLGRRGLPPDWRVGADLLPIAHLVSRSEGETGAPSEGVGAGE